MKMENEKVLEVDNLHVSFQTYAVGYPVTLAIMLLSSVQEK